MLAQGKEWSNAMQREFRKGKGELRPRESLSDDREKIPGLVPTTLNKLFVTLLLFLDNRELSEKRDSRCLALPLHTKREGDCVSRRAEGEARHYCCLAEAAVINLRRFEPKEHEIEEKDNGRTHGSK
jgi:hypothetical protein